MQSSYRCYTSHILAALFLMAASVTSIEASDRLIESMHEEDARAVSILSNMDKTMQDIQNSMQHHNHKIQQEEAKLENLEEQKQKVARQKQMVARITQKRLARQKQELAKHEFAVEMLKEMKIVNTVFNKLSDSISGQEEVMDELNQQLDELGNRQNALVNQTLRTSLAASEQQKQDQGMQLINEKQAKLAASIAREVLDGQRQEDYLELQQHIQQIGQEVRNNVDLTQSVSQILQQVAHQLSSERAHTQSPILRENVLRR